MKIRYTQPALADLKDLAAYIDAHSFTGGRRVRQRIKAAIGRLADHPLLGRQTDDPTIRRLTTTPYPYLVYYEVTDADIVVHAVRHGARDPTSMPDVP